MRLNNLYSTEELINLFKRETGCKVDEIFIREFGQWIAVQSLEVEEHLLPFDLNLWVISKAHEYFSQNCCN